MPCRLVALFLAVAAGTVAAEAPPVLVHDARIELDIDAHRVTVEDRLTVPAGGDSISLDPGCTVTGAPLRIGADGHATVAYRFDAHQPTDEVRFSRENVGGEITATVGDEGVWLSGASAWLPAADGALTAGRFEVVTPPGWYPVMSGEMEEQFDRDGRRHTVYRIDAPIDDVALVANRFTVMEREHGGVTMRTCFLEPDDKLTALYLERTAHYLDLYADLLGPYPYASFTTVENWFPTGYGLPGWTLLGSQVLRLPFIPYTSFGHEICHNWWGNSVFVDSESGNWCAGLTFWCADYLYKLEESAAAARAYRRNQLKDYAAYVGGHPERDFALTAFTARHSGATRAVGYGKSMMVWHMLEQEIGRDTVLRALRSVYTDFRGRRASWSDFFAALEQASDRDLGAFRAQWLERTGAPALTLADVARDGDRLAFTLRQTEPAYDLLVPVAAGAVRRAVRLTGREQRFTIEASGAADLTIDPDNDIFRSLDPSEIEPTLSRVLAAGYHVFVPPRGNALMRSATGRFARVFCECDVPDIRTDGVPDSAAVNVLVNPAPDILSKRLPAELQVHGDLVFVAGRRVGLKDHDIVFAAASPGGGVDLVILTRSAPRLGKLGGRLGHYGKYSWLLFPAGAGPTIKGNWTPIGNPLAATLP